MRIGDVAARTGLTERAIRHYEREGLVAPERSESGQRLYGEDALKALARARLLRRAGFSIADIRAMGDGLAEPAALIDAQLKTMQVREDEIREAVQALETLKRRVEKSGADIDVLCDLLQTGERCEDGAKWRAALAGYFNPDEAEGWMAMRDSLRERVDPEAYDRAWHDLINDIKTALPLDPSSDEAQDFLDRWNKLLEPFRAIASKNQQKKAAEMWGNVGDWGKGVDHPMTQAVADFIRAASQARSK